MSYFASNEWGKSRYQDLSDSRVRGGKLEFWTHLFEEMRDERYDFIQLAVDKSFPKTLY